MPRHLFLLLWLLAILGDPLYDHQREKLINRRLIRRAQSSEDPFHYFDPSPSPDSSAFTVVVPAALSGSYHQPSHPLAQWTISDWQVSFSVCTGSSRNQFQRDAKGSPPILEDGKEASFVSSDHLNQRRPLALEWLKLLTRYYLQALACQYIFVVSSLCSDYLIVVIEV